MGRYLKSVVEIGAPIRQHNYKSSKAGEDCENLPKKERIHKSGTWRYACLNSPILERMMKKHVNEPYDVLYTEIAARFKNGTLERRKLEEDLIWMIKYSKEDTYRWTGYHIVDGIIRLTQKVHGVMTTIIL